MPDTPYIDNSVIGFDPHSNLRFQVDTYNRLSPILNLHDQPMFTGNEPSPLRDNFSPDTVKDAISKTPLPDMSIRDALSSDDPKVQAMGRDAFNQDMIKNVPEYKLGLGRTVETPYEQGQKYLDKEYGFSRLRDNEDFYYKNVYMDSSWLGRSIKNPVRFLGRLLGGTLAKVGESLGYMGSMVANIGASNYFEKVADNGFSRWFQKQEQTLKDQLIPVYKKAGFDDQSFFSKLGDWSFWNDEVADAGAFMASAIVQTLATDGLGNAIGLGRIGSLGINTASKLGKFGRALDGTIKFLTGAEDVAGIANHAFNTASESFFEAAGVFDETKQDLVDARKRGENVYTDDQINRISSQRAASDFKGNLMALTLSNAFENKYIFQPVKKFVKGAEEEGVSALGRVRTRVGAYAADTEKSLVGEVTPYNYRTKTGKFFDWKNPQSRLRFYGTRALTSSFVEGLYEENIQLAMERMSRYGDYENKNTLNAILGTLKTTAQQAKTALTTNNDKEAGTSIGLGALIGVLGTGAVGKLFGGKRFFQGERQSEIDAAQQAVDNYNNQKKEFLSFSDIYKTKQDGSYDTDDQGNLVVDEAKAAARADGLSAMLKKTITADQLTDPVGRKLLQDDALSDFVHAAISAGLDNSLLNRLKGLPNKAASEIRSLGFNPAEINTTPQQLVSDVQELIDMHKKSFASTVTRPAGVSSKDYSQNENLRKFYLYKSNALSLAAKNAFNTLDGFLTEEATSKPLTADTDSAVREHNSLSFQLEGLKEFGRLARQNGTFYNDYINNTQSNIQKRQREIKNSLKDKIDNGELIENDSLLMSPSLLKTYSKDGFDVKLGQQHGTLKNAQSQYEYTVSKLSSTNNGYNNFQDFKNQVSSKNDTDERADEQPDNTPENVAEEVAQQEEATPAPIVTNPTVTTPPITASEIDTKKADIERRRQEELFARFGEFDPTEWDQNSDLIKTYNEVNAKYDTELAALNQPQGEEVVEQTEDLGIDTTQGPPIDLSKDTVPDEIDPFKPVSFWNPNITSKNDTTDVSDDTEQLSTDDYSVMRGNFIKRFVDGNTSFPADYKLYIVKDTYPEVYKSQVGEPIVKQKEDGTWEFLDSNQVGQVVIVHHKDGSVAKVSDFFPDQHKEFAELPIIFSFDQNVFFAPAKDKNPGYPRRLQLKAEKGKMSTSAADTENKQWRKEADDAREKIKEGKEDKVQVTLFHSTGGLNPKTVESVPVAKRFGDFDFEVAKPIISGEKGGDVEGSQSGKQYGSKYYSGQIIIKIGKYDFPAFTRTIAEYPDIYSKVQAVLEKKFDTVEDAQAVRNDFLGVMINTNEKQFFTIDKEGDKFVIHFRTANDTDLQTKDRAELRKTSPVSNPLVGQAVLNVSATALKGGFRDFDATTGETLFRTPEEYTDLIKPKIMTNLKKIIDRKGNLYMETVNPYFSFLVNAAPVIKETRRNNYDALKNRIETLTSSNQLDIQTVMKGLNSEKDKGNISQEQYDDLKSVAESYKAPAPKETKEEFWESMFDMLGTGVISPTIFNMSAKKRLEEHPEEKDVYDRMMKEKEEGKKVSLSDKYKKQDKPSIGDTVVEQGDNTAAYVVENKYVYTPADNKFTYVETGRKVAVNHLPNLLEKMSTQYPYAETATGNQGFNVFREGDVAIYKPPTSLPSTEIVVVNGKIASIEEARKQLPDSQKLNDFLNKYCS